MEGVVGYGGVDVRVRVFHSGELHDVVELLGGDVSDEDDFVWLVDDDGAFDVVIGGGLVVVVSVVLGDGGLGGGGVDGGDCEENLVVSFVEFEPDAT